MSLRHFVVASCSLGLLLISIPNSRIAYAEDSFELAFTSLDTNGDGFLSGTETATVRTYDQDDDAEISFDEYIAGRESDARKSRRPVAALDAAAAIEKFQALDGNRDDRLSGTEMLGIERYDTNGDLRITKEEYLAGVSSPKRDSDNDRVMVVPVGEQPFMVTMGETVRITGNGTAGSRISAEVSGPAKATRANYVRFVIEGEPAIGGLDRDFEIEPTGVGEVSVVVTVEYPTGDTPSKSRYRFNVR